MKTSTKTATRFSAHPSTIIQLQGSFCPIFGVIFSSARWTIWEKGFITQRSWLSLGFLPFARFKRMDIRRFEFQEAG